MYLARAYPTNSPRSISHQSEFDVLISRTTSPRRMKARLRDVGSAALRRCKALSAVICAQLLFFSRAVGVTDAGVSCPKIWTAAETRNFVGTAVAVGIVDNPAAVDKHARLINARHVVRSIIFFMCSRFRYIHIDNVCSLGTTSLCRGTCQWCNPCIGILHGAQ